MNLFKDRAKSKEDYIILDNEFSLLSKTINKFLLKINDIKFNNIIHSDQLLSHMFDNYHSPVKRDNNSSLIKKLKQEHSTFFTQTPENQINFLNNRFPSNSILMSDFNIDNIKLYLLSNSTGNHDSYKRGNISDRIQINSQITILLENIHINIFVFQNQYLNNIKSDLNTTVVSGFNDHYFSFNAYQNKKYVIPILQKLKLNDSIIINFLKNYLELHNSLNKINTETKFIKTITKENINDLIDLEKLLNDDSYNFKYDFLEKPIKKMKNE